MNWIRSKLGQAKISRALANAQEEALFAQAANEVVAGDIRPGLWAKAVAAADGDERRARARYISLRVEQLQLQVSAAEEVARLAAAPHPGHPAAETPPASATSSPAPLRTV